MGVLNDAETIDAEVPGAQSLSKLHCVPERRG
jgi:hypothetical protein